MKPAANYNFFAYYLSGSALGKTAPSSLV